MSELSPIDQGKKPGKKPFLAAFRSSDDSSGRPPASSASSRSSAPAASGTHALTRPNRFRTEADYETALARVDELMDAEPGSPDHRELDVLVDLVGLYERTPLS